MPSTPTVPSANQIQPKRVPNDAQPWGRRRCVPSLLPVILSGSSVGMHPSDNAPTHSNRANRRAFSTSA